MAHPGMVNGQRRVTEAQRAVIEAYHEKVEAHFAVHSRHSLWSHGDPPWSRIGTTMETSRLATDLHRHNLELCQPF
jgi:hypothetical protein